MKRFLTITFAGLIAAGAYAATNPLLSAPANNVSEWQKKIKEFEKPEVETGKEYPKPFHIENEYVYKVQDVCVACHTYAPHKKDKKFSPFYNAHSTFLSCNTCHFVKSGLEYRWEEIKDGKISLKKFGNFYGVKYVKVDGKVMLSGMNSDARIVPVDNGVPVEIPLKGNESLLKDVKAVASMHNALTDKPLKCLDCHKPDGKLDFVELGFSSERVKDLEHNDIVNGLIKYKVIHFPKFVW
ncbi:Cytochrome c554 and c-prime [Desulfurobacterium pacificum]|uniref:Cytochrome c554 and c-prime n=1 Tax=Desulfurobacterium pacificum TaxID=240166 RepID=A0ABY1NMG5_9BACT|nr:multiheme c-type cytochrome [Desulfurobacterium pacificum]SMP12454.1 Cytochrome c554 and c-prime [Desulfurobacterium pacificum]